jgi:SAM-dependent methyltransferase
MFPEFFRRWRVRLTDANSAGEKASRKDSDLAFEYRQVVRHFQTQWQYWGDHSKNFGRDIQQSLEFLRWTLVPRNAGPSFFDQKLILDAGCGHGKYLSALSDKNVEVVGMDITRSIDLCQRLVGDRDNIHLVQGDVIHPPFAKASFDYVYSNGVIHHTPDTRRAFRALAALPKTSALYAVWVYPYRAKWWDVTQHSIRSITTRLPPGLLRALCYIPVPLLSIPGIGAYSNTSLKTASWAECAQVIFDFYGPKYQTHHTQEEIESWFREEGYNGIEFGPDPLSVIGVRA